jgi:hypothetical protein
MGIVEVTCLAAAAASVPPAKMRSTFRWANSLANCTLRNTFRPSVFDDDDATLDPAELAQSLLKRLDPSR